MSLTELEVRNAKPKDKAYVMTDGRGLLLSVKPSGRKYWIVRTWVNGKEHQHSLGAYPDISLKQARELCQTHKARPVILRSPFVRFSQLAELWLEDIKPNIKDSYVRAIQSRLRCHILPVLGDMRVCDITTPVISQLARKMESAGIYSSERKVLWQLSQMFDYAIDSGQYGLSNPVKTVLRKLKPLRVNHLAAIVHPEEIGNLMRAINAYPYMIVRNATLFSAYCFCRPKEIATAEWSEIDLQNAVWIIPKEKMKAGEAHAVPLSRQAMAILLEQKRYTKSAFVFPTPRDSKRPISAEAVRIALRTIGISKEEMTAHGFRSMASTVLNEHEWPSDAIELQLAHSEHDAVRAAYNRAEHWDTRVKMMQWYADYIDRLAQNK